MSNIKEFKRVYRHKRIRKFIIGTLERPRLCVHRSLKNFYAQIVDDSKSHTLVFCSTLNPQIKKELQATWSVEAAKRIGEIVAKVSLEKGIKKVVFDRGGLKFHGKVLAFANSAREAGLEF